MSLFMSCVFLFVLFVKRLGKEYSRKVWKLNDSSLFLHFENFGTLLLCCLCFFVIPITLFRFGQGSESSDVTTNQKFA